MSQIDTSTDTRAWLRQRLTNPPSQGAYPETSAWLKQRLGGEVGPPKPPAPIGFVPPDYSAYGIHMDRNAPFGVAGAAPATRLADPNPDETARSFMGEIGASTVRGIASAPQTAAQAVSSLVVGPEAGREIGQQMPGAALARGLAPTRTDVLGRAANIAGGVPGMLAQGVPGMAAQGFNTQLDRTGGNVAAALAGAGVNAAAGMVPLGAVARTGLGTAAKAGIAGAGMGATNVAAEQIDERIARAAGADPQDTHPIDSFLSGAAFGAGSVGLHRLAGGPTPPAPEPRPPAHITHDAIDAMSPQNAQATAKAGGTRFITDGQQVIPLPEHWYIWNPEQVADRPAPPEIQHSPEPILGKQPKPKTERGLGSPYSMMNNLRPSPDMPVQTAEPFTPTPNVDRGPWQQVGESERLRMEGEDVPRLPAPGEWRDVSGKTATTPSPGILPEGADALFRGPTKVDQIRGAAGAADTRPVVDLSYRELRAKAQEAGIDPKQSRTALVQALQPETGGVWVNKDTGRQFRVKYGDDKSVTVKPADGDGLTQRMPRSMFDQRYEPAQENANVQEPTAAQGRDGEVQGQEAGRRQEAPEPQRQEILRQQGQGLNGEGPGVGQQVLQDQQPNGRLLKGARVEVPLSKAEVTRHLMANGVPEEVLSPGNRGKLNRAPTSRTMEDIGASRGMWQGADDYTRLMAMTKAHDLKGELNANAGHKLTGIDPKKLRPGDAWDLDGDWRMEVSDRTKEGVTVDAVRKNGPEGIESRRTFKVGFDKPLPGNADSFARFSPTKGATKNVASGRNANPLSDNGLTSSTSSPEAIPGGSATRKIADATPNVAEPSQPYQGEFKPVPGQQQGLLGDRYAGGITGKQEGLPFSQPSDASREDVKRSPVHASEKNTGTLPGIDVQSGVKEPWQMTAKQFEREYAQHVNLRAKTPDEAGTTRKAVREQGFGANSPSGRSVVNTMPIIRPDDTSIAAKFRPDVGQDVYLVPRAWRKSGANGLYIKQGWKPRESEVVQISRADQSLHEAVVAKALSEGKPVPPEVLKDYPDLSEAPVAKTGAAPRDEERSITQGVTDALKQQIDEGQKLGFTAGPHIISHELLDTLGIKWAGIVGRLKGLSVPRLMKADPKSGEAAVEVASSRVAAQAQAQAIARRVLGDDWQNQDFRKKLGAVLTEDQLRASREQMKAANDPNAASVKTLVGDYFATEADYKAALNDPKIQAAIQRDRTLGEPVREGLYRRAADIEPTTPLTLKGPDTGLHISLRRLDDPNAPTPVRTEGVVSTLKKNSPFNRKRTGTGNYDIDYTNMLENSLARNAPAANLKTLYQSLIDSGNAVEAQVGRGPDTIKGEKAVPMAVQRGQIVRVNQDGDVNTFSNSKNLYVRDSVANEVLAAAGEGRFAAPGFVRALGNKLTGINVALGFADQISHITNLTKALVSSDAVGPEKFSAIAGQMGGAPKLLASLAAVGKAAMQYRAGSPEILDRVAYLSKIGAMREHIPEGTTPSQFGAAGEAVKAVGQALSKPITVFDRATRLALDEAYSRLVSVGLAEDTAQGRREFINQAGQYNTRLQGEVTRFMRQTGLAPFATAGAAFNRLGVRNATLSPSVPTATGIPNVVLRGAKAAALAGTIAQSALITYLFTGSSKTRPGVPPGAIDTGQDDENGRPLYWDALDKLYAVRRGLRVIGQNERVNAITEGRAPNADKMTLDAINANTHPLAGPLPRSVSTALTSRDVFSPTSLRGDFQRTARMAPIAGDQAVENLRGAGSRVVSQLSEPSDLAEDAGGGLGSALIKSQLRPLMPNAGQAAGLIDRRGEIDQGGQLKAYLDDTAARARKLPLSKRQDFIDRQLNKVPEGSPMTRSQIRQLYLSAGLGG